jgi:hypothetical protein
MKDILLLPYVDILLAYAAAAAEDAEEITAKLAEVYKITNLEPARQFLGIEIYRENDGSIGIGQKDFIDLVLKRFHMENAYNAITPLDDKRKLDLAEPDEGEVDRREYQAIIRSRHQIRHIICSSRTYSI